MSRLAQILEDQFAEAKRRAGTKIVRRLSKGLRVGMNYVRGNIVLGLARDDAYPSAQEWQTVCKHLPFVPEKTEPTQTKSNGRYVLYGELRIPQTQQIKFL